MPTFLFRRANVRGAEGLPPGRIGRMVDPVAADRRRRRGQGAPRTVMGNGDLGQLCCCSAAAQRVTMRVTA
jgi:hypothetical protein